jgi:hypothetical protein
MLNRRSLLSDLLVRTAIGGGLLASARAFSQSPRQDFVGVDGWLNTNGPLTMAGLRGKVVLVQFCTYTCINWRRTLPYVKRWHAQYGPQGLQIVGVHTPEFTFERIRPNVEKVLGDLGVSYPIAQDNEYRTWRAWDNSAWPSFYLVNRQGQVRLAREGEGHSMEIEEAIRSLLGLPRAGSRDNGAEDADLSRIRSGEFYFGSSHDTPQDPVRPGGPRLNRYDVDGTWARTQEALVLQSATGRLRVRFSAAKLHLVAGSPQPATVRVSVDGQPGRTVEIGLPTLYTLDDGDRYGEHLLELECATPGLSLVSTTFS